MCPAQCRELWYLLYTWATPTWDCSFFILQVFSPGWFAVPKAMKCFCLEALMHLKKSHIYKVFPEIFYSCFFCHTTDVLAPFIRRWLQSFKKKKIKQFLIKGL